MSRDAGAHRWKFGTIIIELLIAALWWRTAWNNGCLSLCTTGGVVICVFWAAHCFFNHVFSNVLGVRQHHEVPAQYTGLYYYVYLHGVVRGGVWVYNRWWAPEMSPDTQPLSSA